MNPTQRALKAATLLTATAALMGLGLGAASAHVKVVPASTAEGGYSQLTFSVPNESETAKTSRIDITLPAATVFTSVSVRPIDGWTAEVITSELPAPITANGATITKAVSSVSWTADAAHQLGRHEFQTFTLSVGTLPAAGTTVLLPAAQTYTDGNVVNWDEAGADTRHPAPSFVTTAAVTDSHGHDAPAAATLESGAQDPASRNLGFAGLGAGLLGLAAGGTALVRTATPRKK